MDIARPVILKSSIPISVILLEVRQYDLPSNKRLISSLRLVTLPENPGIAPH
jgi:hypothetical protein